MMNADSSTKAGAKPAAPVQLALPGILDATADPWRDLPVPPEPGAPDELLADILEVFDAEVAPEPEEDEDPGANP